MWLCVANKYTNYRSSSREYLWRVPTKSEQILRFFSSFRWFSYLIYLAILQDKNLALFNFILAYSLAQVYFTDFYLIQRAKERGKNKVYNLIWSHNKCRQNCLISVRNMIHIRYRSCELEYIAGLGVRGESMCIYFIRAICLLILCSNSNENIHPMNE